MFLPLEFLSINILKGEQGCPLWVFLFFQEHRGFLGDDKVSLVNLLKILFAKLTHSRVCLKAEPKSVKAELGVQVREKMIKHAKMARRQARRALRNKTAQRITGLQRFTSAVLIAFFGCGPLLAQSGAATSADPGGYVQYLQTPSGTTQFMMLISILVLLIFMITQRKRINSQTKKADAEMTSDQVWLDGAAIHAGVLMGIFMQRAKVWILRFSLKRKIKRAQKDVKSFEEIIKKLSDKHDENAKKFAKLEVQESKNETLIPLRDKARSEVLKLRDQLKSASTDQKSKIKEQLEAKKTELASFRDRIEELDADADSIKNSVKAWPKLEEALQLQLKRLQGKLAGLHSLQSKVEDYLQADNERDPFSTFFFSDLQADLTGNAYHKHWQKWLEPVSEPRTFAEHALEEDKRAVQRAMFEIDLGLSNDSVGLPDIPDEPLLREHQGINALLKHCQVPEAYANDYCEGVNHVPTEVLGSFLLAVFDATLNEVSIAFPRIRENETLEAFNGRVQGAINEVETKREDFIDAFLNEYFTAGLYSFSSQPRKRIVSAQCLVTALFNQIHAYRKHQKSKTDDSFKLESDGKNLWAFTMQLEGLQNDELKVKSKGTQKALEDGGLNRLCFMEDYLQLTERYRALLMDEEVGLATRTATRSAKFGLQRFGYLASITLGIFWRLGESSAKMLANSVEIYKGADETTVLDKKSLEPMERTSEASEAMVVLLTKLERHLGESGKESAKARRQQKLVLQAIKDGFAGMKKAS